MYLTISSQSDIIRLEYFGVLYDFRFYKEEKTNE